ncbi:MAG: 30S ribosomal protein S12 methylthiotransferase RimO [Desulfobacterales bacterium]|nr:30S ribosomal protein S12 methylthiotransferase RimO [Desulfobacterales bacterium]
MSDEKIHLVSLGCARNLVDSEIMLGRLANAGWTITQEPDEADVIIINTCSFIEDAADESVDTILELAKLKKSGSCRNLIVAGCLPERYREDIVQALPEVDVFLGTGAFDRIVQAAEKNLKSKIKKSKILLPDPDSIVPTKHDPRIRESSHMAYLKIAEGCSKHCTYCIIPKLRGKQKSRSPENITDEARSLIESGVKELVLIAQDTTNYGSDLPCGTGLARLLDNIADISDDIRIRVLYGHPESIDESVIKTVAQRHNICSYFDIPIQHASNSVLKKMGRHYTGDDLKKLFDKIRSPDPEASLRTTVITGFPGETDKDFETLLKFVEDVRFNHLGVFTYSDSEDLPSHRLSNHVSGITAEKRYNQLMSRQMEISLENNSKYIGRTVKVLVEESPEPGLLTGRTCFQAPEVDGLTDIRTSQSAAGSQQSALGYFADVKITDALEYDLIGELT